MVKEFNIIGELRSRGEGLHTCISGWGGAGVSADFPPPPPHQAVDRHSKLGTSTQQLRKCENQPGLSPHYFFHGAGKAWVRG